MRASSASKTPREPHEEKGRNQRRAEEDAPRAAAAVCWTHAHHRKKENYQRAEGLDEIRTDGHAPLLVCVVFLFNLTHTHTPKTCPPPSSSLSVWL